MAQDIAISPQNNGAMEFRPIPSSPAGRTSSTWIAQDIADITISPQNNGAMGFRPIPSSPATLLTWIAQDKADITISPQNNGAMEFRPPLEEDIAAPPNDRIDWHLLSTKAFNAACKRKGITTKDKATLRKERRRRKNARYSKEFRKRGALARASLISKIK